MINAYEGTPINVISEKNVHAIISSFQYLVIFI